jgi:16S rRNA (adenine1518-N6/adenine1519-N6)-dimethyltransferase
MKSRPPRKRFGQNFPHDPNIIHKIISNMNPQAQDHFVEIGPGQGAMTKPLSAAVSQLDVIEIDQDLADDLLTRPWANKLNIHRGDALRFPFDSISTQSGALRLAGNLPYNISTPLLFHILDYYQLFRDIHVMLQKEVVQRMTAQPGSKTYGRLTVSLAARCHVESLFIIGPGAFRPAPKVESAFARLTPLPQPLVTESEAPVFDDILRRAFGQRRKQLQNTLRDLLTAEQIQATGISPTVRAEMLSVEQFVALTQAVIQS